MSKRAILRRVCRRVAAVTAAITILAAVYPLSRGVLGARVALIAASLRQPAAAVSWLEQSLFPTAQTVVPPAALAPMEDPLGDTTAADTPADAPVADTPTITRISPPGNKGDGGKIIAKKMDTGNRTHGIATLNRSGTAVNVAAALGRELTLQWASTEAPQVLILHTHTTESYTQTNARYEETSPYRTLDPGHNMLALGKIVAEQLENSGIGVVHDTTFHDYPSYNGSYSHAAAAIRAYLEQYPTIELILDLHRDAADTPTGQLATRCQIDGERAAQLMFVLGTDTRLKHPKWEENLSLALKLQVLLEKTHPGICRDLSLSKNRYNQHLGPRTLLVEIGAAGNTLEEAKPAAMALAKAIAQLCG